MSDSQLANFYLQRTQELKAENKLLKERAEKASDLMKKVQYYDALVQVYQTFLKEHGTSNEVMLKFQETASKRAKQV